MKEKDMSKRYLIQFSDDGVNFGNLQHLPTGTDWVTHRFETATADVVKIRQHGESRALQIVESAPVYATKVVETYGAQTPESMAILMGHADVESLGDIDEDVTVLVAHDAAVGIPGMLKIPVTDGDLPWNTK